MTKIQILTDETLTVEEVKKILDTIKAVEKNKPDRTIFVYITDKDLEARSEKEAVELIQYFVQDKPAM